MSGLINKVKDALHSDKDKTHEQPQGTTGPHSSRAANTADPRVDSDRDHRANPTTGTHSTTGTTGGLGSTGTHSTTTGTHGSGLTGSNTHGSSGLTGSNTHGSSGLTGSNTHGSSGLTGSHGTTGTSGFGSSGNSGLPEGSVGPHSSRAANAADPRVDSDLDGSRNAGRTTGSGLTGSGTHGSSGLTGSNTHGSSGLTGSNTHGSSGLTGSHGSSGLTGSHGSSGLTGSHGSSGLTGSHGTTGTSGFGSSGNSGLPEGSVGPHSSRAANAADPRVDSDLDGSRNVGGRTGGTGSHALSGTGTHGSSGLTGSNTHGTSGIGSNTHGSSGLTGSNTHGTSGIGSNTHGSSGIGGAAAHGSGPAPNTAGPHKSDALNKADPRVDSDLDGSKTVGQDKTFAQSNDPTNFAGRDPTDATQVPPSILQKHVGGPAVHHDNPEHGHSERHSISHQEEHRGL